MSTPEARELVVYAKNDIRTHTALVDVVRDVRLDEHERAAVILGCITEAARWYRMSFASAKDHLFTPADILTASAELAQEYTKEYGA